MGVKRSYRFAQVVNGRMKKVKMKIEKALSYQIIPTTPITPELLSAEGY